MFTICDIPNSVDQMKAYQDTFSLRSTTQQRFRQWHLNNGGFFSTISPKRCWQLGGKFCSQQKFVRFLSQCLQIYMSTDILWCCYSTTMRRSVDYIIRIMFFVICDNTVSNTCTHTHNKLFTKISLIKGTMHDTQKVSVLVRNLEYVANANVAEVSAHTYKESWEWKREPYYKLSFVLAVRRRTLTQ